MLKINMNSNMEFISVCKVIRDSEKDYLKLYRLADINGDVITAFEYNDNTPATFSNRKIIYSHDIPIEEGSIGVWKWSVTEHDSDVSKDWVDKSYYVHGCHPIQIIRVNDVCDSEELVHALKNGVSCGAIYLKKVMFIYSENPSYTNYKGVLCHNDDLYEDDGVFRLKTKESKLPVYYLSYRDILKIKNIEFLRSLDIGEPAEYVLTKNMSEIIKNEIIKLVTWPNFKAKGISKAEWKMLRDFLQEISDTDFYERITEQCDCSLEDAQKHIQVFLEDAEAYVDGTDVDSRVLDKLVLNHTELREYCQAKAGDIWIKNNKTLVDEANQKLKETEELLAAKQKEYEQKQEKCDILSAEITNAEYRLNEVIAKTEEYNAIGEKTLSKVRNKISQARNDVSEFLSELSLFTSASSINDTGISRNIEKSSFVNGKKLSEEDAEISNSWKNTVEILEVELLEAGVSDNLCHQFAAFLYAAYVNNTNLLLAGPFGESIADALSSVISLSNAGVLSCNGDWSNESVEALLNSEDEIIIVKNPFNGNWIDKLPPELNNSGKMIIYVHPYTEDLLIEPNSLYNYMLPVFTELIVDKKPSNRFLGAVLSDDYAEYIQAKAVPVGEMLLRQLPVSKYEKNRIQQLLSDVHKIIAEGADIDFRFCLFPLAIVTDKKEIISEYIKNNNKLSDTLIKELLNYLGEEV